MAKGTIERLKDYLIKQFNGTFIVDETTFLCYGKKVRFYCTVCNTEIWKTPHTVMQGHGCAVCAHKRGGLKGRNSKEKHIKIINELYQGSFIVDEETLTLSNNKALYTCLICNKSFWKTPHDVQAGHGCPDCGRKRLGVTRRNKFIETAEQRIYESSCGTVKADMSTYDGRRVEATCLLCGNKWNPRVIDLIHKKSRCPICSSTRLEKPIYDLLCSKLKVNEDFLFNKALDGCRPPNRKRDLRPDFRFLKVPLIFELDGQQHVFPLFGEEKLNNIKINDEFKNHYYEENGYILIRAVEDFSIKFFDDRYKTLTKLKELIELGIDDKGNVNIEVFKPYDFNRKI